MNKFVLRQSLLLLLAAFIWGVAFVAQSVGMEYVGPLTFNAVRSVIGGVTLLPCIAFAGQLRKRQAAHFPKDSAEHLQRNTNSRKQAAERTGKGVPGEWQPAVEKTEQQPAVGKIGQGTGNGRQLAIAGATCGILLCIATNLQQIGIQYTTVGKSGFITAMYIVIVPVIGLFVGKRAGIRIWGAVVLAVIGLYFLCVSGGALSVQRGDLMMLLCAVTFSFHIMVVDHFASKVDGVKLSCIQFFVSGILSGIGMFLFEEPQLAQIFAAWLPILYAGVLSCGVAYTLQIIGQRGMNPTVASLLLSMEAVISVIAGWAILHQRLSVRELFGCGLMLFAIILVQLPEKKCESS